MKNDWESGEVLELIAPTAGVVSGTPYLIGSLLVVAGDTIAQTLPFRGVAKGVFDLDKVAEQGWTQGVKLYWDNTAKKITTVSGGNTLVGVAVSPVTSQVVTLATNALAADLLIVGMTLQVLDFAQLETDNATVTVTINGVAFVLTEDAQWDAVTSNNVTATNLAAAINALTGVTATATTDTVTVVAATGVSVADFDTGRVRLDGVAR